MITCMQCEKEAVYNLGLMESPVDLDVGQFCQEHALAFIGGAYDEPLKMAVMLAQKVQPQQYESAEVSLHIAGVTVDTSDDEIDALVERGNIVYARMAAKVGGLAKEARQNRGFV